MASKFATGVFGKSKFSVLISCSISIEESAASFMVPFSPVLDAHAGVLLVECSVTEPLAPFGNKAGGCVEIPSGGDVSTCAVF